MPLGPHSSLRASRCFRVPPGIGDLLRHAKVIGLWNKFLAASHGRKVIFCVHHFLEIFYKFLLELFVINIQVDSLV